MTAKHGSGWVRFKTVHPAIMDLIEKYCEDHDRNDLEYLPDESAVWRRDPDESGRGVAVNNECADFRRLVANAVFKFSVGTVHTHRAWPFNYRRAIHDLIKIENHGWNEIARETDDEIDKVEHTVSIQLEVHKDGHVTGSVVE